jgi:hypothetical protein
VGLIEKERTGRIEEGGFDLGTKRHRIEFFFKKRKLFFLLKRAF